MKKAPSNKELHDLADNLEARIRTLEGEARERDKRIGVVEGLLRGVNDDLGATEARVTSLESGEYAE